MSMTLDLQEPRSSLQVKIFILPPKEVISAMGNPQDFKTPNPGIGFTWIIQILMNILVALFPQISEELRKSLIEFLLDFYRKAMETDNPWDDFLARFLSSKAG